MTAAGDKARVALVEMAVILFKMADEFRALAFALRMIPRAFGILYRGALEGQKYSYHDIPALRAGASIKVPCFDNLYRDALRKHLAKRGYLVKLEGTKVIACRQP